MVCPTLFKTVLFALYYSIFYTWEFFYTYVVGGVGDKYEVRIPFNSSQLNNIGFNETPLLHISLLKYEI